MSTHLLAPRRRAWLWTACAALLVVIYLVLWSLYSMTHLSAYARYERLPPGASTNHLQADFRLLSLVQTRVLTAKEGDPQSAPADGVWVVAELEVVRRADDPNFVCLTALLGPDKRAWDVAPIGTVDITRVQPAFCPSEDVRIGVPYRFEQVYLVPDRYADELYGVVIVNHGDARANQVLSPPT